MANFYVNLKKTASDLLKKFNQGVITYSIASTSGPAWDPIKGTKDVYTLNAVASGVGQMYRNNSLIVESDKLVIAGTFSVTPDISGIVSVDGVEHEIVQIKKIPEAGTTIAWQLVVRK